MPRHGSPPRRLRRNYLRRQRRSERLKVNLLQELRMLTRLLSPLAIMALAVALTTGCAKKPESELPRLTVLALAVEHCSKNSPELRIGNVPPGTASFEVSLRDLNSTADIHGGGTYRNDGTGVVPEGALKNRYAGPCSRNSLHRYEFAVLARDASGKALASGVYAFNF